MPLYTVHAPPTLPGDGAPDPMGYVFVKEGFCWPAFFIAELWLLFRRMWIVFFAYIIVAAVLTAIGERTGGPLPGLFLALAHFVFAMEGNQLRRWTLRRRGYRLVDVVEGDRLYEAELRFFLDWPGEAPPATPAPEPPKPTVVPPPAGLSAESGEVVGLFPAPGGRS
jgi:hypothetical protein